MDVDKLRERIAAAEDGFAMITVIGVIVASLALASVAAVASVNALGGTVRDEDSKTALAAADAGAAAALARQNSIAQTGSTPCLSTGAGGVLVASAPGPDGWCAATTGSVDGATYSYQVAPAVDGTVRVVSVGSSDGVNRRIELTASDTSGSNVFAEASLIGLDSVHMDSNARAHSNTASNGSISLDSNARLCGAASVGVGGSLVLSGNSAHGGPGCAQSTYPQLSAPTSLDAVQQGDAATNNKNTGPTSRFFTEDYISGPSNKVVWDETTRNLELKSNVALTLGGGGNYSFCQIKMGSNTTLYITAEVPVRVFFDSPENCNGQQTPLLMASNSRIVPTSGDATDIAMLFVGSDAIASTVRLNSNSQPTLGCSSGFVIYAPKSHIQVNSNVTYCGALAGKSIELDSNAVIQANSINTTFELPGAGPHYVTDRFVECSVSSPGTVGEGC